MARDVTLRSSGPYRWAVAKQVATRGRRKRSHAAGTLFSDLHGNVTGTRAVLEAVDALGGADVLVCHSTPASTISNGSRLAAPLDELRAAYGGADADVVVHGHVHAHAVRWIPKDTVGTGAILLAGVGSVGARADGLRALTVLEFARGHWAVRQFQVPYDTQEEARLCRERGAPDMTPYPMYRGCAERLTVHSVPPIRRCSRGRR